MLKVTKDRKVTNAVTPGGNPAIANSFGLPAGIEYSCPMQTAFCGNICYAGKLERIYKGVRSVLLHNWHMVKDASEAELVSLLDAMITRFETQCDKRGADKAFRIHWDGDFYSDEYTRAWWTVIAAHPNVQYWVYTRVPTAAAFLHSKNLPNLALYYSADRDNIAIARSLENIGVNIAYVDETFANGKREFPNATKCPENNRAIPLISDKGSACMRCGLCVNGRKSVLFSTTKR